ncbi:MAG TPA: hypothetical protein DEP36_07520 [Gammaproteobacteria bacterium]|nr:hypothetical protein [Gammaproteobacteria bacterium]
MTNAHLDTVLNRLTQVTGYAPQRSGDEYRACCPVHEADGRTHTPSLSVRQGDQQEILMNCHVGCDYGDIVMKLGMDSKPQKRNRHIVATYSYQDAAGQEVRQKVRYEPKGFAIRHQDAAGQWVYKAGSGAIALYRLPELLKGIAEGQTILIVEGEKDVDRLAALEWTATTNIEGASEPGKKAKWRKEYTAQITGAGRVVLIPDNDAPGRAHMQAIATALRGKVEDIRWLELPGLPDKGDLSDWLDQGGHTQEELLALVEQAPAPRQEATLQEVIEEQPPIPAPRSAKIRVNAGELPEAVDAVEAALMTHSAPIYQRGDALCRVVCVPDCVVRGGKERPQQVTSILLLDAEHLLDRINRLIHFERWSDRKNDYARCHAPRAAATALLARVGEWQFPALSGVVNAPTLRPDGSLLDQPGYDPATGLLFESQGVVFPPIPERPARAQAEAALTFIKQELLAGFPFAEPSDRAAALSALLTALIRPALRTAPMHTFDAPHPGSGKSLLADVVALVATGNTAKVMSFTRDPEEMRKRILSVLLQGAAVINLDNLEEPLQGAALCSALSQTSYSDRLLQYSRTISVSTCCTWLATGNNLQVIGDITRRCIPCRLDAQCEHPEEREFKRDLYDWIPEHRPELVAAGLTVLRAYLAAGKPKQPMKALGGFEDWSNTVRAALIWLGEADPNVGRAEFEEADPDRLQLRALMLAWYATFKSAGATSKEAVAKANETRINDQGDEERCYPDLWEVLNDHFQDRKGMISTRVIGEFLKKFSRRVEIGARFDGTEYGTRTLWHVVIVDQNRLRKFTGQGVETAKTAQTANSKQTGFLQSVQSLQSVPPSSENFAASKNDIETLIHGLKNGYRGRDRAALMEAFGWDKARWEEVKDAAMLQGLIEAKAGFWYATGEAP